MRGFLKNVVVGLPARMARKTAIAFCLALTLPLTYFSGSVSANRVQDLTVKASFDGKTVTPDEAVELTLSRQPATAEGRIAVVIGSTDLTDLFVADGNSFRYSPKPVPLPTGENELVVYLVLSTGEWKPLASFKLKVVAKSDASTPVIAEAAQTVNGESVTQNANGEQAVKTDQAAQAQTADASPAAAAQAEPVKRRFGFDKFEMTPQLNIGVKSQFAETHFPDTNKPERPTFADATIQGTWKSEMTRGTMQMQQQFDFVGSSFRNEALRFAELGANARKIELSSYLMQFQHGTRKFNIGHTSFGAHRHLVNNFSSRGLTLAVPITNRFDVSVASMNSTNIVGFDNFWGLNNPRHRMFTGIIGFDVFSKRPGGLRFETGVSDAWFLSNRQNFTQGNINDSERSRGLSFRVLAKDKSERVRLDAGFTRSQFFNPNDPLLNQNVNNVVQSSITTRSARYADVSVDLLKEFSFKAKKPAAANANDAAAQAVQTDPQTQASQNAQTVQVAQAAVEPKKLNLTLNVRHERVDPLFRSIGAATQADLQQNVVELVGAYGELTFTAAHTRFNDNLAGIQTILRTNTRRDAFAVNTPLQNLFSNRPAVQPNPFLPRLGYVFERTRASADFIPIGGGFDQPGAIPDQANINQSVTAEWQFSKFRASYRLNHTLQDNRAVGRERADLQNFVHTASFGWNPLTTLELNLDVNFEDANNREQANTDRNLRFGFNATWQATSRQTFNAVLATVGAGDLLRTNDSRNREFDFQWNYRLTRENENKFKKVQMIYFIRYSNRFARTRNFVENVNNLTRLNTFNTGLNFIFF